MFDQIERLIRALGGMPETMDQLRTMTETIALYSKIALIIGAVVAVLYALRLPLKFVIETLRWREMRTIDRSETEAAETRAAVEIAQAKKGRGEPVTVDEIATAAESDYGRIVQALRRGRKKLL